MVKKTDRELKVVGKKVRSESRGSLILKGKPLRSNRKEFLPYWSENYLLKY